MVKINLVPFLAGMGNSSTTHMQSFNDRKSFIVLTPAKSPWQKKQQQPLMFDLHPEIGDPYYWRFGSQSYKSYDPNFSSV